MKQTQQRVTLELVLKQLRRHNFAVLSTSSDEGIPDSAGVNYGVARPGRDLATYVMTRRHLKKARNIAQTPNVSLVIPLARRVLWFLPPPTMQLHGRAEILDWTDAEGTEVFSHFWMGRRILAAYRASHRRGENRICFLKITPNPVITTYMVGTSIWDLTKRMESGAAKVVIPQSNLATSDIAPTAVITPPVR
jgi:Pyridoxamine 5'-phosphate oxidase